MGPRTARTPAPGGTGPPSGIVPVVVLITESPHRDPGIRIDPPPSLPVASGTIPEASAAADPPDEPPGERSRFQGLLVTPQCGLMVSPYQPNSGVVVLPRTMQPAARSRPTWTESCSAGGSSAFRAEP